jgi:hypothetical protein
MIRDATLTSGFYILITGVERVHCPRLVAVFRRPGQSLLKRHLAYNKDPPFPRERESLTALPPVASGSGDHHRDVQRPWLKPKEEAIEERGAEEISDDGAGAEAFHVSLRIMLSGAAGLDVWKWRRGSTNLCLDSCLLPTYSLGSDMK